MTELCELAKKWGTDKLNHDYTPYYHELFKDRRQTTKKVLEIGIGNADDMGPEYHTTGASLFMWEEYFPNADIYALDIDPATLINKGRIHSFQCNQAGEASLKRAATLVGNDFDLIVDDGSHVPRHQNMTARIFVPLLASDGIYIIEDVWWAPGTQFGPDEFQFKYEQKVFNGRTIGDDRLIVIRP